MASMKFHCNYCQENINDIRVKCAECPDFDLCLQCFSCGAEIGTHRNNHSYLLINCGNFPLFQPPLSAWKAKEELRLLEAIEHSGFGNWADVAEHVETKSASDVENHYNDLYIMGNIGQVTWSTDSKPHIKDHTIPEGGPLSPGLTKPLSPVELSLQEQQELGYMPNRDEFEREYDNEAELVVCNLQVNKDDEDIDVALKLAQVDMYSRRLRERLRKKKVAREYGLVNTFFNNNKPKSQNTKKHLSKEEKEFQEKMQVFCQFQAKTGQEQFFKNLQKEKELKLRIKELMRYRRNGITKISDCKEFNTAQHKRERKKETEKKSGSSVHTAHRRASMVSKKSEEKGMDSSHDKATRKDDNKEESKEAALSSLPGFELLSEREKKLCSSLGLKPSQYITSKALILMDHLRKQQGITGKPRYSDGLDKVHRQKITNFLVDCGCISAC